jgi:hypothetical protein
MPSSERLTVAIAIARFVLRQTQFASVVIAGYAVCYLVWMHNHHRCRYINCPSPGGAQMTAVPVGEVLMIISVRTPRASSSSRGLRRPEK